MGDEPTFGATNVRFGVLNPDGTCGEFQPLGDAVSFDFKLDSDEASCWADTIANLHTEYIEIKFKSATHRLKMLRDVFGLHVFTIRELKLYGKSTKRMRKARGRR